MDFTRVPFTFNDLSNFFFESDIKNMNKRAVTIYQKRDEHRERQEGSEKEDKIGRIISTSIQLSHKKISVIENNFTNIISIEHCNKSVPFYFPLFFIGS